MSKYKITVGKLVNLLGEIQGSHSSEYQDLGLMRCDKHTVLVEPAATCWQYHTLEDHNLSIQCC